ncbi:polysaccharide biosynthesis/export family protein [Spirosoma daeguense]
MTLRKLAGFLAIKFLVVVLLGSCAVVKPLPPELEYFQTSDSLYPAQIKTIAPLVSRIEKRDILGIMVSSSSKEYNDILNFNNGTSLPQATFSPGENGAGNQTIGFPVDSLGYITLPLIGKQKLAGLTLQQAEEKLRVELEKTLKFPSVIIRFVNHKFTVLGEVGHVGTFSLLNDQTTLIDAIAAAGDLSVHAKRDSIKIIRTVNNRKEIGIVSLKGTDVFLSPYYYVHHDDIIYVEPTKDKAVPAPPTTNGIFLQRAVLYMGLLSTLISLGTLISRF